VLLTSILRADRIVQIKAARSIALLVMRKSTTKIGFEILEFEKWK
jgi:hypothetical protein